MEKENELTKKVFLKKYGAGDITIVMVPGGPGLSYHYLEPLAQELADKGYSIYLYEPTGYPNSSSDKEGESIASYGKELGLLINEWGLKDPILYGQSFGGVIVLEFLANNPSYGGKVILSNTFPSGEVVKRSIQQRFNSFDDEAKEKYKNCKANNDYEGIGELVLSHWLPNYLCRLTELPEQLVASMGMMSQNHLINQFLGPDIFDINGSIMEWDVSNHLNSITSQILWMSGKWDYLSKEENDKWISQFPNATSWYHNEGSHLVFYEAKEEYLSAMVSFIQNGSE